MVGSTLRAIGPARARFTSGASIVALTGCGRRFHHVVEAEAAGLRAWVVYPTLSKMRLKNLVGR